MNYTVNITNHAGKQIKKLKSDLQCRIAKAILSLETEPRPNDCKKLKGRNDSYRLRIGSFRVLYKIEDKEKIVQIVDVVARKDAY